MMALLFIAMASASSGDFMLDDQFERTHRRAEIFRDAPVVIIAGAQRKTPEAMKAWVGALIGELPNGTRVFGLSNMRKLPFFVPKGSVRKNLAEMLPETPVLMDWKGKVYPALGFPPGAVVSVGAFDASGERLGLVAGDVTERRLREVVELLSPADDPGAKGENWPFEKGV